MSQRAQVRSLDALEAFRSSLIVYLSQARPALEEVAAEVMRVRSWLENEQRTTWEKELRKRSKQLEQTQQALFSSRLGILKKESAAEQLAFHRAKHAVEEAEEKLRIIKRWAREYDTRVQPLLKQTEKLHTVFSNDMVKAVTFLTQTIATLAAYAEAGMGSGLQSSPPAAEAGSQATTTEQEQPQGEKLEQERTSLP